MKKRREAASRQHRWLPEGLGAAAVVGLVVWLVLSPPAPDLIAATGGLDATGQTAIVGGLIAGTAPGGRGGDVLLLTTLHGRVTIVQQAPPVNAAAPMAVRCFTRHQWWSARVSAGAGERFGPGPAHVCVDVGVPARAWHACRDVQLVEDGGPFAT